MSNEQRPVWQVILEIRCKAPEEFFMLHWEDIPQAYQEMLDQHGPIPCEGSGEVDLLCVSPDCHWVEWNGEVEKSDSRFEKPRSGSTPGAR